MPQANIASQPPGTMDLVSSPEFMNKSLGDKAAHLDQVDPDFAQATPEQRNGYLIHLLSAAQQSTAQQPEIADSSGFKFDDERGTSPLGSAMRPDVATSSGTGRTKFVSEHEVAPNKYLDVLPTDKPEHGESVTTRILPPAPVKRPKPVVVPRPTMRTMPPVLQTKSAKDPYEDLIYTAKPTLDSSSPRDPGFGSAYNGAPRVSAGGPALIPERGDALLPEDNISPLGSAFVNTKRVPQQDEPEVQSDMPSSGFGKISQEAPEATKPAAEPAQDITSGVRPAQSAEPAPQETAMLPKPTAKALPKVALPQQSFRQRAEDAREADENSPGSKMARMNRAIEELFAGQPDERVQPQTAPNKFSDQTEQLMSDVNLGEHAKSVLRATMSDGEANEMLKKLHGEKRG